VAAKGNHLQIISDAARRTQFHNSCQALRAKVIVRTVFCLAVVHTCMQKRRRRLNRSLTQRNAKKGGANAVVDHEQVLQQQKKELDTQYEK